MTMQTMDIRCFFEERFAELGGSSFPELARHACARCGADSTGCRSIYMGRDGGEICGAGLT